MRLLVVGMLTAVAASAAGGGLYFADGIRELASAIRNESRASTPPRPAASIPQPSAPPIVLGQWEDRIGTSWTQEIRIVEHAGQIVRETTLPSGRVDRDILTEVTPQANERKRFENPSSRRGQVYAITRHGHLTIVYDDGFVHQATKVATPGEQR